MVSWIEGRGRYGIVVVAELSWQSLRLMFPWRSAAMNLTAGKVWFRTFRSPNFYSSRPAGRARLRRARDYHRNPIIKKTYQAVRRSVSHSLDLGVRRGGASMAFARNGEPVIVQSEWPRIKFTPESSGRRSKRRNYTLNREQ